MQRDSDSLRRPMLLSSIVPRKRGARREGNAGKKIRMRNPPWISRFLGVEEKNRMRRYAPVRTINEEIRNPSLFAGADSCFKAQMKQVKIGVGFGLWRLGMPAAETIANVSERAEDWGLDSFWLSDHLLAPSPELDVVATLSLLASRTSRIRLGPSVFLLNLRHPLVAAKSFASLDYLSNGRMVMAVGTGANLADYAACGIPTEGRGRRLDEGIMVLRKVWTEANASFHGRFFNFDNVTIEPRPAHRDHNNSGTVDLWIGGKSDTALMRTAHLSDAFFASFQAPDEFARSMETIHRYAAEAGRADARIESGLILLCALAPTRERAIDRDAPDAQCDRP